MSAIRVLLQLYQGSKNGDVEGGNGVVLYRERGRAYVGEVVEIKGVARSGKLMNGWMHRAVVVVTGGYWWWSHWQVRDDDEMMACISQLPRCRHAMISAACGDGQESRKACKTCKNVQDVQARHYLRLLRSM